MTTQQTTAVAKVDNRQLTLKNLMEASKGAIAQVVPKHLTVDRILKVALTATSRTPKLLECTPNSILQSVMQAAQLGLEPGGPLGHAYLVPFNNKIKTREGDRDVERVIVECQLIVGYRGLIDLARRSSQIDSIEARVVYERDRFKVSYGLDQVLEHVPAMDGDSPGKVVCAYAIARLKGSNAPQIEVMSKHQIDAVRAISKTGKWGPWADHYDEMARKTVVRRICKYLPLTVELADALANDADEREDELTTIPMELVAETTPTQLTEVLRKKAESIPAPAVDPAEIERWKMELQTAEGDEAALRQVFTNAQKALGRAPEIETLYLQLSARAREPKQS